MTRLNKVNLLTISIFTLTLCACSSTHTVSSSTTDRGGSTKETAIPVKSVDAEYQWIKANYPGSKVMGQALITDDTKQYDLLTIVTPTRETKKVYFDITSFFGKF